MTETRSSLRSYLRKLRSSRLGTFLNIVPRFKLAISYYTPAFRRIISWTFASREFTNFTYDISERSIFYASQTLSIVTGYSCEQIAEYMEELRSDNQLKQHVISMSRDGEQRYVSDPRCDFGRRLFWYATIRAMKPKLVVETGIDKGLGSVVLCSALIRNASEGSPGKYIGVDINPAAGWLLCGPYREVGTILYGDSIETISELTDGIDIFINDSDHSAEYEAREYEAVARKLTKDAIILGDNAHVTDKLAKFSSAQGRRFLYLVEQPEGHWYPGGGVGISF